MGFSFQLSAAETQAATVAGAVSAPTTAQKAETKSKSASAESSAAQAASVLFSKEAALSEAGKDQKDGEAAKDKAASSVKVEQKQLSELIHLAIEGRKAAEALKAVTKKASGEVSIIDSNGIAVLYDADKKTGAVFEMFLPFEGEIKFVGYKGRKEIRAGDQATLTYEEFENQEKRTLKIVRLDEKAPYVEEVIGTETTAEENVGQEENKTSGKAKKR